MRVIFPLLITSFTFSSAMKSQFPATISEGLFILALAAETQSRYPITDGNPAHSNDLVCNWNGCHYTYDPVLQCIRHMHGPYKPKQATYKNSKPKSQPKKK